MFFASVAASRNANCAVGGHDLPDLASTTAAQSPNAQTPAWPGTASVASTITAPRLSFSNGSDKRGAVIVDATLAVPGHAGVWALGDCAAVVDAKSGKSCPP